MPVVQPPLPAPPPIVNGPASADGGECCKQVLVIGGTAPDASPGIGAEKLGSLNPKQTFSGQQYPQQGGPQLFPQQQQQPLQGTFAPQQRQYAPYQPNTNSYQQQQPYNQRPPGFLKRLLNRLHPRRNINRS